MTRRRWIGLAATGIAGLLALSGCGGPDGESTGSAGSGDAAAPSGTTSAAHPTALRMVAADYGAPATKKYWNTVIDGFEKAHPGITVSLQLIPWKDIDAQVGVMVRNNQVPDLLQTDRYAPLATSGQLYSADDVLSDSVADDLIGPLKTAGSVDGVSYGIPFAARPHLLVYNKKLFRKAKAEPPRTWTDIAEAAAKLRGHSAVPYGMALGPTSRQGVAEEGATAEAAQWMLGNGATLTDDDGRLSIGGGPEADALGWVREHLVDAGLTDKNPAGVSEDALTARFAAGKVGMMSADPTVLDDIRAARHPVDYGVVAVPGRDAPLGKTLTTSDWMMAFRKNGHRSEIKEFLDYLYAPARQASLAASLALLPVTDSGRRAADGAHAPRRAALHPWLDALTDTTAYPVGEPAWRTVEAQLRKGVGKAVTGGQTAPTEVVDQLRQAISEAREDQTDT